MTARRIPHAIPALEGVVDPTARSALEALRTDVMTLYGLLGKRNDRAVLVSDLLQIGQIGFEGDSMYSKLARALAASASVAAPGGPVPGTFGLASVVQDMTGGKAVGTYECAGFELPVNSYIVHAFLDVQTTFVGGVGATCSWGVATDDPTGLHGGGLLTAYTAGVRAMFVPDFATAGDWTTITTAARKLVYTIGVADATAGQARIVFAYFVAER